MAVGIGTSAEHVEVFESILGKNETAPIPNGLGVAYRVLRERERETPLNAA